ncbi:hypothetical protein MMPV_008468 [Pyropia vietnamensis]
MADAPITRSRSVPSDASRPTSGPAGRGGGSRPGQAVASGIPTRSPILPADGQDVGPVAVSFSDLKATLEDFRSQIIADLAGARSARRPEAQEERGRRLSQGSDTTRTRRRRRRARRSRSSSSSPSTTSESSTSEDSEASDKDPIPAQVAHHGTGSASTALLAPIQCSDDRFAAVLSYETYRLRNKKAKYGSAEARKMGRKTRDMKHSFAGHPPFSGKEPLRIFAWLRKFVKACNDNDVTEGMALYAAPHFMTGDAEVRYTRVLPDSAGTASGAKVDSYPEAVNWLLLTYAEPHTLALAQDTFSRAIKEPDEPVEAFASRLRALSELCGNIHSEGTMKQQLIQGLPEYVRTDAFVFNTSSATYQQLATYTAGKVKAAQDMARLGQPSSSRGAYPLGKGPRRTDLLPASRRNVEREDVFVVRGERSSSSNAPRPMPDRRTWTEARPSPPPEGGSSSRPRRAVRCFLCWEVGHMAHDCQMLTAAQREKATKARELFVEQMRQLRGNPREATSGQRSGPSARVLALQAIYDGMEVLGECFPPELLEYQLGPSEDREANDADAGEC